jgi:plastocyanin
MNTHCAIAFGLLLLFRESAAADVMVTIVADDLAIPGETWVYAIPRSSAAIAASKLPVKHAIVDQQGKEFIPLVSVVRAGSPVDFPNSDNIRHQVYSFSPAKVFNLKLYSGKPAAPVVFDKSGVVTLGCNIHDRMISWVRVVDTPWIARADPKGEAIVKDLPDGEYALHAWHPGIDALAHEQSVSEVVVVAGASRVEKALRVSATPIARLRQQLLTGGDNTIAPPRPETK